MIVSFRSKETKKIWHGEVSSKLPREIQDIARRKSRMLSSAQSIRDLQIPPSNHLKKMKGKLKDYHSIRINNQWRIIFKWDKGNCTNVEITDYH